MRKLLSLLWKFRFVYDWYYKFKYPGIHRKAYIGYGVVIRGNTKGLIIGEGTNIPHNSILLLGETGMIKMGNRIKCAYELTISGENQNIIIGNDCLIATHVMLISSEHKPMDLNNKRGGDITIGNKVWMGAFSIILKNTTIGNNVVIGAGSVVTKNIPDNEIWAGNPTRRIR